MGVAVPPLTRLATVYPVSNGSVPLPTVPLLAIATPSVNEDFVIFHDEAFWDQPLQITGTTIHFKHASASPATEVMVVILPGQFIALWFAGNIHDHDRLSLGHTLQCAIDRCQAHLRHGALRALQQFLGRKGAVFSIEHIPDSPALCGITLHGEASLCFLLRVFYHYGQRSTPPTL
jgi:hypothetical protein